MSHVSQLTSEIDNHVHRVCRLLQSATVSEARRSSLNAFLRDLRAVDASWGDEASRRAWLSDVLVEHCAVAS